MPNSDDPYIRSTTPPALLAVHAAARAKDPSVPPIARPYWTPGGPLFNLGMAGVEKRIQLASESEDDLMLSFIAQDPDSGVRHAAARNPNMPRILRDAIQGVTEYSPEEASQIWFDVWKTDPQQLLSEHGSESGLPNVLLARGYFAEDFDDVETARRWFRAASSIGVTQGRVNLARLSDADDSPRTGGMRAVQAGAERHSPTALLPVAVSLAILAVIFGFIIATS